MADPHHGHRIDVHHHFYAPEYLAVMGEMGKRPVVRDWTVSRSLEEMDQNGVASSMLSLSPPGLHHVGTDQTRKLARAVNDHAAKLRSTHPSRFGHFASVPMPDVDGTLAEIAYALDQLKADGIPLMTSYGERYPGHPDFTPVMEELNRRKALVFIHPLAPICCAPSLKWIAPSLFEFTQDTNRCVFSLLFTGTLAQFPDIRFIFCHSGAAVPILAGRAEVMGVGRQFADKLPNGVEYELKRLYYEIAGSANPPAMAALMKLVPTSQILFGSDYPWGTIGTTARGIASLGLSVADLKAIGRDNAMALLPRFGT